MLNYVGICRTAGVVYLTASLLSVSLSVEAQTRSTSTSVTMMSTGSSTDVEALRFVGLAVVNSRLASGPDIGSPSLVMQFDLTGVTGIGTQTGIKYSLTSQEYFVKPLEPNLNVEFTVPMATNENAPLTKVRVGLARFAMNVDVRTGAITSLNAVMAAR